MVWNVTSHDAAAISQLADRLSNFYLAISSSNYDLPWPPTDRDELRIRSPLLERSEKKRLHRILETTESRYSNPFVAKLSSRSTIIDDNV